MEKDVRVMSEAGVNWEAVWGCNCEMEVIERGKLIWEDY